MSIQAEPPVAIVDRNVDAHGTRTLAGAYLNGLYGETGQEIAARSGYRPTRQDVIERHAAEFPALRLFRITDIAADWADAQRVHFAEGGLFDRISAPEGSGASW
jgi:sulfate transport system substrate-binding protein